MAFTIEVPGAVHAAIRALLTRAGRPPTGDAFDMSGIVLTARAVSLDAGITVSTLLSSQTKEGRVELALNGELTQMDLPKAREIVRMLNEAIEAAASDQMIWAFLTQHVGLADAQAARAMGDFREIRQGSRGIVHPS